MARRCAPPQDTDPPLFAITALRELALALVLAPIREAMSIDKKAATRQYKETPRTAGVALARNLANGKCFLFAGVDIPALVNRHRTQLKFGGHPNKMLQRDWNAVGADQFEFEVVDTLPAPETADADQRDDVAALEALWLEKLAPYEPAGYNRPPKPST